MSKFYGPYHPKKLLDKNSPIVYDKVNHISKKESIIILKKIEKELGEKIWTKY